MTPPAERDWQLVASLRLAEPTAAEELVASYGGRALRLAIGITGNQADGEEGVQDALWTVVRKIDTFAARGCIVSSRTSPMTSSAAGELRLVLTAAIAALSKEY